MAGSAQETDQLTEWVSQRLPIVDGRSTPMLQNSEEQEAWLEQRSSALGLQPNTVKRMVGAELQRLNADIDEDLDPIQNGERSMAERSAAIRRKLDAPGSHAREQLELLLGIEDTPDAPPSGRPRDWWGKVKWRLSRVAVGLWMNILILATIAAAAILVHWGYVEAPSLPAAALSVFVIWALSFLPGWMFVRFIGQRAGAIWDEYVLQLHRLGWDEPENLPQPPPTSRFYARWVTAGGYLRAHERNIYQQKFDAYYGKSVSKAAQEEDWRLRAETLFPVFLTAVVFAVCWTALLWPPGLSAQPSSTMDMLKYGFLGAYSFNIQMLVRRFFQSDLRASAYASAVLRVVVVLILIPVMHQLFQYMGTSPGPSPSEAIVAFIIGFFPLVAMQALQRAAAVVLHVLLPTLTPEYPLNQLDGLNAWYEARLLEESIEDMQNLCTANFVDVMLHTRVPAGRLVDWVDQAFLYLHFDRAERGRWEEYRARRRSKKALEKQQEAVKNSSQPQQANKMQHVSKMEGHREGSRTRNGLRQLGIRTATDLINAFPPQQPGVDDPSLEYLKKFDVDPDVVRMLSIVLRKEEGLNPILNWRANGSPKTVAAGDQDCEPSPSDVNV